MIHLVSLAANETSMSSLEVGESKHGDSSCARSAV